MRGSFLNKNRILAIAFGTLTVVSIFANPGKWASEPARTPFVESEPSRSPASLVEPDITRSFTDAPKRLPSFIKEDERRSAQFQNIAPVSADADYIAAPSNATLEAPFSSPVYNAPTYASNSRFYSGNYAGANSVNTASSEPAKKSSVASTASSNTDSNNSANNYNPSVTSDGAFPNTPATATGSNTINRSTASSPPVAPTGLLATGAPGSVVLTWGSVSGATMYTVERSLTVGGTFTAIATGISSATYSDFAVTNNITYYYRVTALNSGGGAISDIVSAIPSDLPTQPTLLLVASNGSASLTWTASIGSGTITYSVERSLTLGSGYSVVQSALSGTSFTDSSLTDGTLYYYRVQAHNLAGDSTYSSEISAKAIHSFLAGTATAGEKSAVITWASATGATTYDVKYGTTPGTYTSTASGVTSPASITGLTAGTPYYFSVKATNSDHGLTLSTNELTATPLGTFSITALTPVDIGKFKITWGASTSATSYDIGCGTTTGTYTTLTFTNQTSPATLSGFSDATAYFCMVTAKNATGQANASAEATATTFSLLTYTWPFDAGTGSSYSFDSKKLELVGGVSRLRNTTPTDASATGGDFKDALFSGVKWDSVNSRITLDSTSDNSELNSTWTPQYNQIAGYWRLNGSLGATIQQGTVIRSVIGPDAVAENSDGTGLHYINTKQNQGIEFDGTDDFLNAGSDPSLNLTSTLTLSAWVKVNAFPTVSTTQFIAKAPAVAPNKYFGMSVTTGGLISANLWDFGGSSRAAATTAAINLNQWYLVTYTYDGNYGKMYLNGALVSTSVVYTVTSPPTGLTSNLEIGGRTGTSVYFNGDLDEVAIWKTPLKASEIKTLYERQSAKYTGTLLSRVITSGQSTAWAGLNYLTTLPYGKELPNNGASENREDYPALETAASAGAVGYWKLDEMGLGTAPSGADFLDGSGSGNHGTKSGNFSYTASGKINGAQNFNGTDQFIDAGTFTTLNGATTMSASAWVKQNSASMASLQEIMRKENQIAFQIQNGSINFYAGTNLPTWRASGSSPALLTDDQWHFVTGTYDGTTVKVYIDGVLGSSSTYPSETLAANTNHLFIGSMNGGEYFNGALDEVAVYNRTLSPSDVTALYHQNSNLMVGNVGLWHLNETSLSGTSGEIIDSSGANYNATVTSTTAIQPQSGKFKGGMHFNGTENYIQLPTNATLNTVDQGSFTISSWFKSDDGSDAAILMKAGYHEGLQFTGGQFIFYRWDSSNGAASVSSAAHTTGEFHHVAATVDKKLGSIKIYVDGVLESSSGFTPGLAGRDYGTGPWTIGTVCPGCGAYTITTKGTIDEVALWNRPLSDNEILGLYQRGANHIFLQARTCTTSTCSDDPSDANWVGSASSPTSYLSELNNTTTAYPQFLFSDFGGALANQSYFQYRAVLTSDTSSVLPGLRSVSAGPARYDATKPIIVPIDGPKFQIYTGFTPTLGTSCSGTPQYALSHNKSTWYYYTGGTWAASNGSYAQSSDASTVNSHIATFGAVAGTGELYAKIFYPSDTTTPCEIDKIVVAGADSSSTHSTNPGSFVISSVFAGDGQTTLIWGSSSTATGYTICYGTTQALADACGTSVTSATTSKTITGLSNNTQYYFTVYANNASGTTTASVPVNTTPMAPPSAPTSLAATSGLYSTNLTWTGSTDSGNITYNVLRSTTSGSGYTTIAYGLTATGYTDLTALANTQYYYVVTASNLAGDSAKSNEVGAKAIGSFSITSIVGSDGSVTVNWSAAVGASSYDVKYATASGVYGTTSSGQTSGVIFPGFTDGTRYYFIVIAKNATGAATASSEVSVIPVKGYTITAAPAVSSVIITFSNVATGLTYGKIEYGTSPGTYTTTVNGPSNPQTISGLTPGTTYYFRSTAWNDVNGTYTTAEISQKPSQAFNYDWTFDEGTDSSYSFTSTLVQLKAGVCRLTNLTSSDSDNSASGWGSATLSGVKWDTTSKSLILDSSTDDGSLTSSWAPHYGNIIGYWKLNGTAESVLTNASSVSSVVGPSLTVSNTNTTGLHYINAIQQQGLEFDGTDDWLGASSYTGINRTTGDEMSISVWIKPNWTAGYQTMLANRSDAGNYNWILYQHTTDGALSFHGNAQYKTTYIPPNGVWTHIVVTVSSSGDCRIYANGVQVALTTGYDYALMYPGTLSMGAWSGTTEAYYLGSLDEPAIWNVALSSQDVKTIYERQSAHYTGTILSRVMDAGASTSWLGLNWFSSLPFGKELNPSIKGDTVADYSALIPRTDSLLGHWRMDDTAAGLAPGGKDVKDDSGNGIHALQHGTVVFNNEGKIGTSISMAGHNVRAILPASTFASGIASTSFWMYWDGTIGQMPIGFSTYDLYFMTNVFGFNTGNGDLYGIDSTGLANRWVHVAAEFHVSDATLGKLWIDGVPQTLTQKIGSQTVAHATLPDFLVIGGWTNDDTHNFKGRIDDVSLWNRALTQDEVTQLAAASNNLMSGNVGLWHFDEATTGTAPGGADFKDDSGKGNHCTASSGPAPGSKGKLSLAAKNAVGGYISCGNDSSTNMNTAFAFSGWYWFNALTAQDNIIFNREESYEVGARGTFQYALQTSTTPGVWYWVDTGIVVPKQQWVQVGFTYDANLASNQVKFYLNGALAYQGNYTGTITGSSDPLQIGSRSSGGGGFDGYIDEAALWNRALTSTEMSQLYRRGANRINFQVRSCTASDCSDDPAGANWKGWNGANTYFNETMNTTSSVVNSSGPHLLFSDYALGSISSSQYFQYRAVFASDDASTSPDLARVEAGPSRYTTNSSIYTINGSNFLTLTAVAVTLGDNGCSGGTPKYQFSKDKSTWYYYDSSNWVSGSGYAQANDIATANTNFPALSTLLGSGTIYMKAYLPSSGTTPCEIDKVTVSGTKY